MLKLFTYSRPAEWDAYVRTFPDWDVYYLCEYALSLMPHGDGEPLLLCCENEGARMCYVVMKNDIADCPCFKGTLPYGRYFDFETPYGYGGPLVDGEFSDDSRRWFAEELSGFCGEHSIVSQFIRFHPLLANHRYFPDFLEAMYMRETVYIDASSEDLIYANLDSKNRNMIRKAIKRGIQVDERPADDFQAFYEMYTETMRKNNACAYYYFDREYFACLGASLKKNSMIFYAMLDNEPVGGALCLYNEKYMHYHLAGTRAEYRNFAAGNLLVYEAALSACRRGITRMHLGGGLSENDSLFGFKAQFNRNGRLPYYIGRTIFDRPAYDFLLRKRKELEPDFDTNNGFMIQYRR